MTLLVTLPESLVNHAIDRFATMYKRELVVLSAMFATIALTCLCILVACISTTASVNAIIRNKYF